MNAQVLLEEMAALPPDKQQEVEDFVAFLRSRIPTDQAGKAQEDPVAPGKSSGFFGMWADRPEMADSVAWVRSLREGEWESRHA